MGLFLFRKSKIIVDCFVSDKSILDFSPIEKANKFIPDWWNNTPLVIPNEKQHPQPTMRGCSGIIEHYKNGFMIPMWSDLSVTVQNKGYSWQFSDYKTNANVHPSSQWDTFADKSEYGHLKISSPYFLKTKKDISWICTEPFWNNQLKNNYFITPGTLNFKYQHATNINMMIPLHDRNFIIKHGHPMLHLIPLSEYNVELKHNLVSQEEIRKLEVPLISFTNSYFKRKSITDKKCPFHFKG